LEYYATQQAEANKLSKAMRMLRDVELTEKER
jgi:hypothetical protein